MSSLISRNSLWLLLTMLAFIAASCQTSAGDGWTPLYLQVRVCAGKAQVQRQGASEWVDLANGASLAIKEKGRVVADPVEGVQFCFGDGSVLELAGGSSVEMQDLGVFPRLQVVMASGVARFTAQKPSYEFVLPGCSARLETIPTRVDLEVNGVTSRIAVAEGSVRCTTEEQTITLVACTELVVSPGMSVQLVDFCAQPTASPAPAIAQGSDEEPDGEAATPTPLPAIPTPAPTTPAPASEMATPTPEPPTATPKPTLIPGATTPVPTATPVPPTATQPPPPTQKPPPPPTNTPPPPPTNTPPPPPPTSTPLPPPTDTPPPPPTNTPPPPPPTERPTPGPTAVGVQG